jgi:hypothetical protein
MTCPIFQARLASMDASSGGVACFGEGPENYQAQDDSAMGNRFYKILAP